MPVQVHTLLVGVSRTGPQGPPGGGGGGGGGGAVDSVFGRTGAVTAQNGDYTAAQVTGAVADDDPRLSDARAPTAHASSHVGGSDPIPVASESASGLMSAAHHDALYLQRELAMTREEFDRPVTLLAVTATSSGTGSGVAVLADDAGAHGVGRAQTGTDTAGRSCWHQAAAYVRIGDGVTRVVWRQRVDVLSDGTNTYAVYSGIGNSVTAEPTNGVYFKYASGTSANWIAVTANGGTRTETISSIAVATTYQRLWFVVNAAGTEVAFYIGDTLVATHTTNIPAAGVYNALSGIFKSAGTTNRELRCDTMWVQKGFTSARA